MLSSFKAPAAPASLCWESAIVMLLVCCSLCVTRWGLCTSVQPCLAGSASAYMTTCCCAQCTGDSIGSEAKKRRESEGGTTGSLPDDDAAALTLRTLEREVGLPRALLQLAVIRMPPLMVLSMRHWAAQHQDVKPLSCPGSLASMLLAVT